MLICSVKHMEDYVEHIIINYGSEFEIYFG